jgi:serine protease Do
MKKKILLVIIIVLMLSVSGFAQTGSIRNYVGVINQTYHPSIVDFFENMKEELDGDADTVKAVDRYLKGPFGTGFVYVDEEGDNYIITNNHVINQAYQLRFTLEKADGAKLIYEGLKVLAVDEDMDLAILVFADEAKPFETGLPFLAKTLDEGETVFSAGFPGIGSTPIYQFGSGIVSNRSTMLPVDEDSDEMIGPFIQHTAPIDPGNSGGPLLVRQSETNAQYAVIGINTLKALWRESTNYAIPAGRAMEFITKATSSDHGDQRAKLEERVHQFIAEAKAPRAIYSDIAAYLSNACIADNAEYALLELEEKSNMTVRSNIIDEFSFDPVSGMQLAVAWLIENSMRTGSGAIKINLESIVPINEHEYTVNFAINDGSASSTWIIEYGIWRISTFGEAVVGDKTIADEKVEEKERVRTEDAALITDYGLMIQGGLTLMPDMEHTLGFNAGLRSSFAEFAMAGFDFTGNGDYKQFHAALGFKFPIRLGAVAIIPLAEASVGLSFAKVQSDDPWEDDHSDSDMGFGWGLKAGLMFTTKYVKGLYAFGNYQYNSVKIGAFDDEVRLKNSFITFGIGYGFH